MKKGDILFGRKGSDAIHPIVFLRENDKYSFVGTMLTTSPYHADNILMAEKHFKKEDSNGKKFKFGFSNTHLVKTELIKKNEWKPFKKVGELTAKGIEFIESNTSHTDPILWEDYLRAKKRTSET